MTDYSPFAVLGFVARLDGLAHYLACRVYLQNESVASVASDLAMDPQAIVNRLAEAEDQVSRAMAQPNPAHGLYAMGDRAALRAAIESSPTLAPLRGQALMAALNAAGASVPAPIDDSTFLDRLGPASLPVVRNWPGIDVVLACFSAQDRPQSRRWVNRFKVWGWINAAESAAILAAIDRTVPGGPTVAELVPGWGKIASMADLAAIGKDK